MTIWDRLAQLWGGTPESTEEEDRSIIRREIHELRTTRERADARIDELQRQVEQASRQYRRGAPPGRLTGNVFEETLTGAVGRHMRRREAP